MVSLTRSTCRDGLLRGPLRQCPRVSVEDLSSTRPGVPSRGRWTESLTSTPLDRGPDPRGRTRTSLSYFVVPSPVSVRVLRPVSLHSPLSVPNLSPSLCLKILVLLFFSSPPSLCLLFVDCEWTVGTVGSSLCDNRRVTCRVLRFRVSLIHRTGCGASVTHRVVPKLGSLRL